MALQVLFLRPRDDGSKDRQAQGPEDGKAAHFFFRRPTEELASAEHTLLCTHSAH